MPNPAYISALRTAYDILLDHMAIEDQRFGWSERKDSAHSRLTRLRKRGRECVEGSEP